MNPDVSIIVLANGDQSRWPEGSPPKQLLEVDGVPLIRRIVDRFEDVMRPAEVLVATSDPRIIAVAGGMHVRGVGATVNQLETLLKMRPFWGATRTICLLGDVFYSEAAINTIASCHKRVAFYGRRLQSATTGKAYGELVAMAWRSKLDDRMAQSLQNWQERPLLWSPYRDFASLWLPEGENYLLHVPGCLTEIDDFTDDFDTPEDWETWNQKRAGL